MSRMANTTRGRRPRRRFDDDFKAQSVRLVLDDARRWARSSGIWIWRRRRCGSGKFIVVGRQI